MDTFKVLVLGAFGIVAIMIVTAAITMVAPYVAALSVLGFIIWAVTRGSSDSEE